jgi:hypothetical protein
MKEEQKGKKEKQNMERKKEKRKRQAKRKIENRKNMKETTRMVLLGQPNSNSRKLCRAC